MSESNGVIRVGRKGKKKFAFGDDEPFEVDVVVAFQRFIEIDDQFREMSNDRTIPLSEMAAYHKAVVDFVKQLAAPPMLGMTPPDISTAEALDFVARLREAYDEVADFFQPRSRGKPNLPDSTEAGLQFLEEK